MRLYAKFLFRPSKVLSLASSNYMKARYNGRSIETNLSDTNIARLGIQKITRIIYIDRINDNSLKNRPINDHSFEALLMGETPAIWRTETPYHNHGGFNIPPQMQVRGERIKRTHFLGKSPLEGTFEPIACSGNSNNRIQS